MKSIAFGLVCVFTAKILFAGPALGPMIITSKFSYCGKEPTTDTDKDGFPDCLEVAGKKYKGIDLYALGARKNQTDVFIEVDYMTSTEHPEITPKKAALEKVKSAFLKKNIVIHFDTGMLYGNGEYNLGGGNEIPFSLSTSFNRLDKTVLNQVGYYNVKDANFNPNRNWIFTYMLFGTTQETFGGKKGPSGAASVIGANALVSLYNYPTDKNLISAQERDFEITNLQAAVIMKQIGHNMGLKTGGQDPIDWKPNYVSIMNYMYSVYGLPTPGETEGDRYYAVKNFKFLKGSCAGLVPSEDRIQTIREMKNSVFGDPANFIIDFASTGSNINETKIDEKSGLSLGQGGSVDFNCDGKIDNSVYSADINNDKATTTLFFYNDWALVKAYHSRVMGKSSFPVDGNGL